MMPRVLIVPKLALITFFSCCAGVGAAPFDAFLQEHCIDCHGPDTQELGLRVDRLSNAWTDADVFAEWVLIYDRVRSGEMPPADAEQPSAAAKDAFVKQLRERLLAAEKQRTLEQGAGRVRRMNRTEYENTLRDLLALPLLRVKELLPEDGQQHGFDKVPGALELSHVQIKKYLEAADVALRQAIIQTPQRPETAVWRGLASKQSTARAAIATHNAAPLLDGKFAPGLTTKVQGNPIEDLGNSYRSAHFSGDSDSLVVFSGVLGAHQPQGIQPDGFHVHTSGWYRVRFSTWSLRWERGEIKPAIRSVIRKYRDLGDPINPDPVERWKYTPVDEPQVRESRENVEFYGDAEAVHVVRASIGGKALGFFDAPSLEPTRHEFKVWLKPGDRVSFHVMSLPATGPPNWGTANGVRSYDGPGVVYDWFEIEGPLVEAWPPESHRRIFGTTPLDQLSKSFIADAPTIGADGDGKDAADKDAEKAVTLELRDFAGDGHKLAAEWMLNINGEISAAVNFAKPGTYELSVTAFQTPAGDAPAQLWTKLDGREMKDGRFDITATRSQPQTVRRSFTVDRAGAAKIGVEFPNDFFDERTKADRNLVLTRFEVRPVKLAATNDFQRPDPQQLLWKFAGRAFRRPVEPREVDRYLTIVNQQLQHGQSFGEAMITGYKAVLCSPDFLFLGLERDTALASRLSYFLWNSMPDEELIALAEQGKLSDRGTLLAQVDRMLSDPRSDRFVEHFLDQWLDLKDIDFTTPDPELYPEFDPWLRDSMLAETRGYFRKLITENRSIGHLVDSDFILANQRLAELYHIQGIAGAPLRAVRLPPDSVRGGLLTQASILKVTANGTATSPVLRGVWVTERILGIPTRPPPPNIPAVEPDATGAVTIRQQIEAHRADTVCASCHKVMDPPGLALENFDVIGGWREHYRINGRPKMIRIGQEKKLERHVEVITSRGSEKIIRLGGAVDASGELSDGRTFSDVNGLRELLLADKSALARNLATQLTIYATGRGYHFADRDMVDSLVAETQSSDYGVRSLIEAVVLSPLFMSDI